MIGDMELSEICEMPFLGIALVKSMHTVMRLLHGLCCQKLCLDLTIQGLTLLVMTMDVFTGMICMDSEPMRERIIAGAMIFAITIALQGTDNST